MKLVVLGLVLGTFALAIGVLSIVVGLQRVSELNIVMGVVCLILAPLNYGLAYVNYTIAQWRRQ